MLPFLASLALLRHPTPPTPPEVGTRAPSFRVSTLDDRPVQLRTLLEKGPVVLVVLRGYPGYQCPFCTKQVGELIGRSDDFARRGSTVVLVYPGPSEGLKRYANDFIAGKDIPANFRLTLDPGYGFARSYGLRWDVLHETAYPSTFVIGTDGRVAYAKVSHSHGDRAPIAEILAALDKPTR